MVRGYSIQLSDEEAEVTARAAGRDLAIKPRHAINICAAIRGMDLAAAQAYLEDVIAKRRAIPFRKHNTKVGHRRGGMGPGRYPVRASRAILAVLANAESNAEYKGLEPEDMFILHAVAQRGAPIEGSMPRAQGRSSPWNKATTHIEIVVMEKED